MDLLRIGNKIISKKKIFNIINSLLQMRADGLSQTDAAARVGIDRTFVSRLENMGEIRKGKSIGVIGFPVANKQELTAALEKEGVDVIYLLTEKERWNLVKESSGLDLLNLIMDIISKVQTCEQVIVIGSDQRIKLVEAVLDKEVIGLPLGQSPIKEDIHVDCNMLLGIVKAIKR